MQQVDAAKRRTGTDARALFKGEVLGIILPASYLFIASKCTRLQVQEIQSNHLHCADIITVKG